MLNQELNIALLELFDELSVESIFVTYKELETKLIENKDIPTLIKKINELDEEVYKVNYQPYQNELNERINKLKDELLNNHDYQEYLKYYQLCNKRLNEISKLVFQDIIKVSEMNEDEN